MNQRLVVTLLTLVGFGAGFGARMLSESGPSVPPPPTLGSEFVRAGAKTPAKPTFDRAKLVAEIEQLRPQIEAFRTRLEAIDAEYDTEFVKVLKAEQRKIHEQRIAEYLRRRAERESKAASAPPLPPLTDEEIAKLRQRPFEVAFWKVAYVSRLEQTIKDYHLDSDQQQQVKGLLQTRRQKFLELVDNTPAPTFRLTNLVTSVQRLTDPSQAPTVATDKK